MKQIADWALGMAAARGASHAEARIVDERGRSLGTRNGRVAVASEGESLGLGVRVLADGGWGFAATQEMTRAAVERCAALAVEIARASARVQREPVRLVDEPAAVAEWSSPCKIDPFAVPIEENFELLRRIDAALTSVEGVTLAETSMIFRRYEQWFYSTEGAAICPESVKVKVTVWVGGTVIPTSTVPKSPISDSLSTPALPMSPI